MREEGETIGKVGERSFARVLSGLGRCGTGWGLDVGQVSDLAAGEGP